jgi:VWFA-related protein
MRNTTLFLTLALIPGAMSAAAAPPRTPAAADPQVFSESLDVRVVNVESVVTDSRGNRVPGLGAADFRLLVDGKEVPIEYFTEVSAGTSLGARAGATATAKGPEVEAPIPAGEAVGRRYLVFVDDAFSLVGARNELLSKIERDLALLKGEDEMAVLAFDGKRLDVLADWTADAKALAAALGRARQRPAFGHQALSHSRSLDEDYDLLYLAAETADVDVKNDRSYLDNRISPEVRTMMGRVAATAASSLRAFPAPPGRKVMMMVSAGWAMAVGPQLFSPLLQAANRLGYTLYPVDAAMSDVKGVKLLDALAARTGGRVVSSAANDALRQVVDDTSSYYWLGFTPTWKADERPHPIVVELRRAGLTARARKDFADQSQRAESVQKAESVLLFGGDKANRRLIVELGAATKTGRHEVEVPITLGVPVEALLLLPGSKGYGAEAPLAVAAEDREGGRADLPPLKIRVEVKEVPKKGTFARFQTKLKLRDAAQHLVFTVHDAVNGEAIWGEAEYVPGARPR